MAIICRSDAAFLHQPGIPAQPIHTISMRLDCRHSDTPAFTTTNTHRHWAHLDFCYHWVLSGCPYPTLTLTLTLIPSRDGGTLWRALMGACQVDTGEREEQKGPAHLAIDMDQGMRRETADSYDPGAQRLPHPAGALKSSSS